MKVGGALLGRHLAKVDFSRILNIFEECLYDLYGLTGSIGSCLERMFYQPGPCSILQAILQLADGHTNCNLQSYAQSRALNMPLHLGPQLTSASPGFSQWLSEQRSLWKCRNIDKH